MDKKIKRLDLVCLLGNEGERLTNIKRTRYLKTNDVDSEEKRSDLTFSLKFIIFNLTRQDFPEE